MKRETIWGYAIDACDEAEARAVYVDRRWCRAVSPSGAKCTLGLHHALFGNKFQRGYRPAIIAHPWEHRSRTGERWLLNYEGVAA